MTLDQARKMVEEALRERKRFGKHFGVEDMPPEFLDALVMVFDEQVDLEQLARRIMGKDAYDNSPAAAHPAELLEQAFLELKDNVTLLNRQLGAAKARETKLRADILELQKDLNRGTP